MQATLDQFLACIEEGDPAQRPVALVDFLLATTTLAYQIRRGGTPLSALQLLAMQAFTEAGIEDACGTGTESGFGTNDGMDGKATGKGIEVPDRHPRHNPLAEDRAPASPEPSAAPVVPFGLAEAKALLVARMEAVRRAQMLAGADTAGLHYQAVDNMGFAMLPLLVLNAHRPRPPLHRRIAADRTTLIRAGLALGQDCQAPVAVSHNRVVHDSGQSSSSFPMQPASTHGQTGQTGDRGNAIDL